MKSDTYDVPLLVIRSCTDTPDDALNEQLRVLDTVKSPCSSHIDSNTQRVTNNEAQHKRTCNSIDEEYSLRPYACVMVWRNLPTATYINKKLVTRYKAPKITEYLDMSTGEIIQAAKLKNDRRVPPEIHVGEIQMLRKYLLGSLRKEVREFAMFVLQFRNSRRGVSPEIDTLVDWYSRIHGKRPSNVKRYVATLRESSFFAGESLLSLLFQRTGKKATSKDHLGEDASARSILLKIRLKARSNLNLNRLLSSQ